MNTALALADILSQGAYYVSHLDLRQNPLGNEGMKILSLAIPKSNSLVHLDVRSTAFAKEGAHHLFKALSNNQTVTCLLLGNIKGMHRNFISGDAMCGISEYLSKSMQLTFLDLKDAYIGDDGFPYLLPGLIKSKSISIVNLSSNNLTGLSSPDLVEVISRTRIAKLDLSHNPLGVLFIAEFYEATLELKYPLTSISLSSCGFSKLRLAKLFAALQKGCYLQHLELSCVKYRSAEVKHLECYLVNAAALKSFGCVNCELGDEGVSCIAEAYSKVCLLDSLNLSMNLITDKGAVFLATKLLRTEKFTLKSLNLSQNRIEVLLGKFV